MYLTGYECVALATGRDDKLDWKTSSSYVFLLSVSSLLLPSSAQPVCVCVCLCLYLFRLGWARTKQAREQHHLSDEQLTDAIFLKFPKHAIKRACIWCITWFSGEEEGLWNSLNPEAGWFREVHFSLWASGSSTAKWEKGLNVILGDL